MRPNGLNDRNKNNSSSRGKLSTKNTQILVYKDLDLVGQYYFSEVKITIGKGKEADLRLDNPRLDPVHAILHIQKDNIIISDQGDRLSIYLNGKPIKAAVLEPYDLIEIGQYGLKIQLVEKARDNHKGGPSTVVRRGNANRYSGRINALPRHSLHSDIDTSLSSSRGISKKQNFKSSVGTPSRQTGKIKPKIYPDDFFELPPYQGQTAPLRKKSSLQSKSGRRTEKYDYFDKGDLQRYSLVFSGKLKSGFTLLNVKYNLTYRFGIESRQLTRLIRGRKAILKRNLTYEKAYKFHQIFDASGAICSIVPEGDPPQRINETKSNKNKDSNWIQKDTFFQGTKNEYGFDLTSSPLLSETDTFFNQSFKAAKKKIKSGFSIFSKSTDLISSPKKKKIFSERILLQNHWKGDFLMCVCPVKLQRAIEAIRRVWTA